jgi:hypothetical protein
MTIDLRKRDVRRLVCPGRATGTDFVMNAKNSNVTFDRHTYGTGPAPRDGGRDQPVWPWVNWGLALSMVPAAAIVMLFALGAVMSTDGCTGSSCADAGHDGIDFGVAFYGAPLVAFVVILITFFTAKRRGGIAVPMCGWALLVADVALMAAAVAR